MSQQEPATEPATRPVTLRHHRTMATRAEIGSLATTLEELTRRVSTLAEGAGAEDEELAMELFGVERSLTGALRRLRKLSEARRT
jgi:hypothetical protein